MARDFTGSAGSNLGYTTTPPVDNLGAFSAAAWVNADTVSSGPYAVTGRWGTGTTGRWLMYVNSSKLNLVILGVDAAGQNLAGATNVPTGSWVHLGCSYTPSSSLVVYLNGVQDGILTTSVKPSLSATTPSRTWAIGSDAQGASLFDGRICDVAAWSAILNAAEFLALAKGVCAKQIRPSKLEGWWPLYGVAYPEPDLSGAVINLVAGAGTPAAANHGPVGRPVGTG